MGELAERQVSVTEVLDELAKGDNNLREALVQILKKRLSERYVRDKIVYRAYPEGQEMLRTYSKLIGSLDGLEDSFNRHLGLDWNWIIAVLCFAASDYAIQMKAKELDIEPAETNQHGEKVPKNSKKLLDEIIQKAGDQRIRLKLFNVYNEEYRNGVIHRGARVDLADAEDILKLTTNLLESFFPL